MILSKVCHRIKDGEAANLMARAVYFGDYFLPSCKLYGLSMSVREGVKVILDERSEGEKVYTFLRKDLRNILQDLCDRPWVKFVCVDNLIRTAAQALNSQPGCQNFYKLVTPNSALDARWPVRL